MIIFEDILHRQIWDIIINTIKYTRENFQDSENVEDQFRYNLRTNSIVNSKEDYANYNNTDFIVFGNLYDLEIHELKELVCDAICERSKLTYRPESDCFLCDYARTLEGIGTNRRFYCQGCPSKIPASLNVSDCLGGLFNIAFSAQGCSFKKYPLISDFIFNSIISACKMIRDIEIREDVITRSSLLMKKEV